MEVCPAHIAGHSRDIVSTCALKAGRGSCMKRLRKDLGQAKILAAAVALFVVCSGLLGGRAAAQGELRFCLRAEPKTFDPLKVEDDPSAAMRYLTGGVLVRINRQTQALEPE